MTRPRLLDLFCGAGGAAVGYHAAGYDVTGVDIAPQPHYPFTFHQADALSFPLDGYDAIHASPPCQAYSQLKSLPTVINRPDLLGLTRERLSAWGETWVIENVPGAPMRADVMLCGSMFGLPLQRHRLFEFGRPHFELMAGCSHAGRPVGVYGHSGGLGKFRRSGDYGWCTADWEVAMAIDWMNRDELAQAIPPAYTEWIGRRLLAMVAA